MSISQKQLTFILMALAGLGSLAMIANFLRDRKTKDEIIRLDHQLKLLELEKMKATMPSLT